MVGVIKNAHVGVIDEWFKNGSWDVKLERNRSKKMWQAFKKSGVKYGSYFISSQAELKEIYTAFNSGLYTGLMRAKDGETYISSIYFWQQGSYLAEVMLTSLKDGKFCEVGKFDYPEHRSFKFYPLSLNKLRDWDNTNHHGDILLNQLTLDQKACIENYRVVMYKMIHGRSQADDDLLSFAGLNQPMGIKSALDEGANVNTRDDDRKTALHRICNYLVLQNSNRKNSNKILGRNYLRRKERHLESGLKMLLKGDGILNVDTIDSATKTPMHYAATKGNANLMAGMLKAGANPFLKTRCGNTCLHFAAREGLERCVRLLCETTTITKDYEERNKVVTQQLTGCWSFDLAVVSLIKDYAFQGTAERLASTRNNEGMTAADLADAGGHPAIASYLRRVTDAGREAKMAAEDATIAASAKAAKAAAERKAAAKKSIEAELEDEFPFLFRQDVSIEAELGVSLFEQDTSNAAELADDHTSFNLFKQDMMKAAPAAPDATNAAPVVEARPVPTADGQAAVVSPIQPRIPRTIRVREIF